MDEDPGQVGAHRLTAEGDEEKTPEQLRAEIDDTRADLGDTVEALAAKTDVKTRAREKADELKRTATSKKDELVAKAKGATSGGGTEAGSSTGADPGGPPRVEAARSAATSAVEQLKDTAQRNPVQAAAIGAFLGGVLVGRGLGRR